MLLNDLANDEDRQRLLPYVTRLACADTKKVEKAQDAYIRRHMGSYSIGAHLSGVFVVSLNKGLEVLEGALAIGRQADLLGHDKVRSRMNTARSGTVKLGRPATAASVPDKSIVSKLKSWLAEITEPTA